MEEDSNHATLACLARSQEPTPSSHRYVRESRPDCASYPILEIAQMNPERRALPYRRGMRLLQSCDAIVGVVGQQRQTTMKKVPFKYHLAVLAMASSSLFGQAN